MFKFNILKENHTGIDITWLIHVNNIVFVSYQIKNSLHELCFHKVVQWPLEIKKKKLSHIFNSNRWKVTRTNCQLSQKIIKQNTSLYQSKHGAL